jgi:hypothetical protein
MFVAPVTVMAPEYNDYDFDVSQFRNAQSVLVDITRKHINQGFTGH